MTTIARIATTKIAAAVAPPQRAGQQGQSEPDPVGLDGLQAEQRLSTLAELWMQQALALIDVKLLDHFIVAAHRVSSLAETGAL